MTRRIADASSGRMVPIQEVVEIAIKPGVCVEGGGAGAVHLLCDQAQGGGCKG